MRALSNYSLRCLRAFKAAEDRGDAGTSVYGPTEALLLRLGYIERIPGRLVSRITEAGRAALSEV